MISLAALLATGMALVPAGEVAPFLKATGPVQVDTFAIDETPVTNGDFVKFVRAHPEWRRSRVNALFAERGYLASWASDVEPGAKNPASSPVVEVSWFAAKAYCASLGKRLPSTFEWERAAEGDADSTARILSWYSAPSAVVLPSVSGRANRFGVRDLFGVIWEWTLDFGDAAIDVDQTGAAQFCGAGAANAADANDAATFMRWAFRSSLRASYALRNLGFRCAKDVTK
jgi:formylglycine-generating enzyme required for sulfatase activity